MLILMVCVSVIILCLLKDFPLTVLSSFKTCSPYSDMIEYSSGYIQDVFVTQPNTKQHRDAELPMSLLPISIGYHGYQSTWYSWSCIVEAGSAWSKNWVPIARQTAKEAYLLHNHKQDEPLWRSWPWRLYPFPAYSPVLMIKVIHVVGLQCLPFVHCIYFSVNIKEHCSFLPSSHVYLRSPFDLS